MIEDTIKATGSLEITLFDPQGNVKQHTEVKNLVVQVGKELIASRLLSNTDNFLTYMAIGTGTTAAASGQTALVTELTRVSMTNSQSTNTAQYSATYNPGTGTGSITEAGIFNAASAGKMLCRTVFGVITKDVGDTLTINWNVTIN